MAQNIKDVAVAGAVAVGVALVLYTLWKGKETVTKVVTKDLNPASQTNLVNRAVTAVGQAVSGRDSWSLGTWIYDVTHPNEGAKWTDARSLNR